MLTRALYFVLLLSTTSDRSKIVIFLVIVVGCLIAWPFVANASNNNLKEPDEKVGGGKGLLIVLMAMGVMLLLYAVGR